MQRRSLSSRTLEQIFIKFLSKDIVNQELVSAVLATGKPVYLSTGMWGEEEIESFLAGLGASIPPNLLLIHTQLSVRRRGYQPACYRAASGTLRRPGRIRFAFHGHERALCVTRFSLSALFNLCERRPC